MIGPGRGLSILIAVSLLGATTFISNPLFKIMIGKPSKAILAGEYKKYGHEEVDQIRLREQRDLSNRLHSFYMRGLEDPEFRRSLYDPKFKDRNRSFYIGFALTFCPQSGKFSWDYSDETISYNLKDIHDNLNKDFAANICEFAIKNFAEEDVEKVFNAHSRNYWLTYFIPGYHGFKDYFHLLF